jgi:hypothetical protein
VLIVTGAWLAGEGLNRWPSVNEPAKKEDKTTLQPGMAIQWEIEPAGDGKMRIVPKVVAESKAVETVPKPAKSVDPRTPDAAPAKPSVNPQETTGGPAVLEAGQSADTPWVPATLLFLGLLVLVIYLIRRSTDAVVRDSEAFNIALHIWKRLVIAKNPNPREIKRFQNRVRYFAMRLRDDRERKVVSPETQQTEAMLVALAALHHAQPALIADGLLFQESPKLSTPLALTTRDFPALEKMSDDQKQEIFNLWQVVRECLHQHEQEKLQWPPPADVIDRFKRWSEGIVT